MYRARINQTDVSQLYSFIDQHKTEVVFFPTAFVKMLFNEEGYAQSFPRCVKHVITAGEQLTISRLFRQTLRLHGMHLHNHYGPSETHVVSTYTISAGDDIPEHPPIGKPIHHNKMYILSKTDSFSLSELRENCIFPERIQEEAM